VVRPHTTQLMQVYPFVARCIVGEWTDALNLEWKRVNRGMASAPALQKLASSRCAAHPMTCHQSRLGNISCHLCLEWNPR
jgi:hypothetical protein